MARQEEADEDFKLPLRPWLEKQINSGKFKGLDWEQCDGETKMFRLPWVKKNLPEWEEYYKIFRAWAEHRGRGEAEGLDDSKLKSNFRCALNKSADFEEITSRSQLHQQTGNYKMYRILTPKEVRERKKSRSKGKPKHEHNFNDDELKTIDKHGLEVLDSLGCSSSFPPLPTMDIDPSLNFPTIDDSTQNPSSYLMSQSDLALDPITTIRPPDMTDFSPGLAISPAGPVMPATCSRDVPMEEDPPVSNLTMSSNEEEKVSLHLDPSSTTALIREQLRNAGADISRLCECRVIVSYNGERVLERVIEDMHKGYRIFYGDKDEQLMRLLQMRNTPEEKLADFQLQGIQLPTLVQSSHTMSAILNKTDLGVVIRYDPQSLRLCAKRLCQSQVFFFDPHDPSSTSEPIKLKREQIVELFSYEKYILQYIHQVVYEENLLPPEADVVLSVGIKPKSKLALPVMKGLKIELIPYALDFFAKNNGQHGSSISLCFSNPISLETLLRTIEKKSSPTKDSGRV